MSKQTFHSPSQAVNYSYEVYIGKKSNPENNVFVYRGQTLDEVCAIALGFFRTSNVPNFRVVVYSVVTASDLITFEKE